MVNSQKLIEIYNKEILPIKIDPSCGNFFLNGNFFFLSKVFHMYRNGRKLEFKSFRFSKINVYIQVQNVVTHIDGSEFQLKKSKNIK